MVRRFGAWFQRLASIIEQNFRGEVLELGVWIQGWEFRELGFEFWLASSERTLATFTNVVSDFSQALVGT